MSVEQKASTFIHRIGRITLGEFWSMSSSATDSVAIIPNENLESGRAAYPVQLSIVRGRAVVELKSSEVWEGERIGVLFMHVIPEFITGKSEVGDILLCGLEPTPRIALRKTYIVPLHASKFERGMSILLTVPKPSSMIRCRSEVEFAWICRCSLKVLHSERLRTGDRLFGMVQNVE